MTLPAGWTTEKLLAHRHVGAAALGDTIEEGKAIRAAIDALLGATGNMRFGPALLATSPEEVEAMKKAARGGAPEAKAPARRARKPKADDE